MRGARSTLRTTFRARVLLVAAVVAGCGVMTGSRAPGGSAPLAAGQRVCPAASTASVVSEVNAARRRSKLGPLGNDARLARIARGRSAAMATRGKLSHRGWERALRDAGVNGDFLGENVAYNYSTAAAVMQSWLTSRGHRANILHPKFRRIGVGCVIDADGRRWWTQDFEG